jgi:hypothetical protein
MRHHGETVNVLQPKRLVCSNFGLVHRPVDGTDESSHRRSCELVPGAADESSQVSHRKKAWSNGAVGGGDGHINYGRSDLEVATG